MQPNIIFGAYMPTLTPAHAIQLTVPLPVNANNEMGTAYQTEAPPISDGPSGGTSGTMSYSALNGLGDREEITITSVGDTNFGSLGPDLLVAIDCKDSDEGALDLSTIDGLGTFSNRNASLDLQVENVPELPQGKGIVVGTTDGSYLNAAGILAVAPSEQQTSKYYEHVVYYWPLSNQVNAQPYITSQWQVKTIWPRFSTSNSSTEWKLHNSFARYFGNTPTDPSPGYFLDSAIVSSGLAGTSWYPFDTDDINNSPRDTYMRDDVMSQQTMVDIDVTNGFIETYLRNKDASTVAYDRFDGQTMLTNPSVPHIGPTRTNIPGYVRGLNIEYDAHMYFADVFTQWGDGAMARVEILDSEDYEAGNLVPIEVLSWSETSITAKIRTGVFFEQSLSGKWLHVHDHLNNHIAKVQLT